MVSRVKWTDTELIVAVKHYLDMKYSKIFKFDKTDDNVIECHRILSLLPNNNERSIGSVNYKIMNIASLDPDCQVKVFGNAGFRDGMIWNKYCNNQELLMKDYEESILSPIILKEYDKSCCVSGMNDSMFLKTTPIVPFKFETSISMSPKNRLCFAPIYDVAYSKGYFTINTDYTIQFSSCMDMVSDKIYNMYFKPYEGELISLPNNKSCLPEKAFLDYHREHIFIE